MKNAAALEAKLVERLKAIVGQRGLGNREDNQTGLFGASRLGRPSAIVRPASTEEVSRVLRVCNNLRQPVVPWGGRTGLVDGAYADGMLALSLERLNQVEEIDAEGSTMTVQAGCILQTVCECADEKGLFFPLDLGARGSATIGGNIATNAGGNRVMRYGMMRDLVLGLEVVLADGSIVSSLNTLIKNNAGYDLKQVFIGSEGTLGVVTRAVLRLEPRPVSQNMALVAVDSFAKLPRILRSLERGLGGTLSAFEVMWNDFYRLVTTHPATGHPPLPHRYPYYVLVEALGSEEETDAVRFERALATELDNRNIEDAAIAKSKGDCDRLWALRDDVRQVLQNAPIFAFDVSLKIDKMEDYVAEVRRALLGRWPLATLMVFGHMGDGNLHLISGVGDGSPETKRQVEQIVYGALAVRHGSISAEHGIGLEKRAYLTLSRNVEEIALMRKLKTALDPHYILNRGKVIPEVAAQLCSDIGGGDC